MVPARGGERNEAASDEGNALAARTMHGDKAKKGKGGRDICQTAKRVERGRNCILLLLAVFAGRGERGLLTYRMLLVVRSRRGRKIHQLLFMLSFLLPASPALSCTARKRNNLRTY